MISPSLFEERFKVEGMSAAAAKHWYILNQARQAAIFCAEGGREITIDDVRTELDRREIYYEKGNWMGSVFKGGGWLHIGFRQSNHKDGHGRIVGVWRYIGKAERKEG